MMLLQIDFTTNVTSLSAIFHRFGMSKGMLVVDGLKIRIAAFNNTIFHILFCLQGFWNVLLKRTSRNCRQVPRPNMVLHVLVILWLSGWLEKVGIILYHLLLYWHVGSFHESTTRLIRRVLNAGIGLLLLCWRSPVIRILPTFIDK